MKKSETKQQSELKSASAMVGIAEIEPVANPGVGPAILVIFFGILFFWGTTYLDRHAGNFNQGVYEPYINSDDLTNFRPVRVVDPTFALGKIVFDKNCSVCHQSSGLGTPGNAPPLLLSEWVLDEGPNKIARIVLNGLKGPITVKGVEWLDKQMVPWRNVLSDEEIAGVVTFIRANPDWGHTLPGITKEEVAKIRKDTVSRGDENAWTVAELKSIPAK